MTFSLIFKNFPMNMKNFTQRLGLSAHTIRYYEKIGLLNLARNRSGHREFCEQDIEWMQFILRLKETGMPLAEIMCYAKLRAQGASTAAQRMQLLEKHAQIVSTEIEILQQHLHKINLKIAHYQKEMQK
jgi:DNA-binding transcriptional MerR regulator